MITDLKKQLFEQYPHKTELHAHTYPISPCSEFSPEALIEAYRETGVEAIALTNHLTPSHLADRSPDDFASEYVAAFERFRECAEAVGIAAIFGIELRFAENSNDYLLFGIDEGDTADVCRCVPLGLERFAREYKRESMLLIQAHPKRNGMTDMPLACLDGVEVFNMHPGHNSRPAIAARMTADTDLIVTGGTDFHHPGHEGCCLLRSRSLATDSHALVALLRRRDYLLQVGDSMILP